MSKPWFDPETGFLLLDDYVQEMPSFKHVLADDVITEDEMAEQADRVIAHMRELESLLDAETRDAVTDVLCELAVLYELEQMRERID